MSSLQSLRELISERLAAAAEEIFRLCEGTIVQYEEELCRQRRLLDICWKPQLQLHHIDLPQHYRSNQKINSSVEHEEQEEPEHPLTEDEQEEPEPPNIKEEQDKQEEEESPQIKEETEEFFIIQHEDLLKQETETLLEIPTFEENENSEADLNYQQTFNVTESQDEEGSQREESTSTIDEETDPQNRDQRKRTDRSHVQSVDDSHMSESLYGINSEEMSDEHACKKTSRKKSPIKKCKKKRRMGEYSCLECGTSWATACDLRRHIAIHMEETPFSCKECSKTFSRKYHLTRHMSTHSGEKPFSCLECHKSFRYSSLLMSHMLIHRGGKLFPCPECHKHFRRRFHLKCHMLTHTEGKLFSCKECNTSFRYSSSLTRHMSTHTGEKLFFCTECNKSFNRNYNLKCHMLSHSQKKASCSQSYSYPAE